MPLPVQSKQVDLKLQLNSWNKAELYFGPKCKVSGIHSTNFGTSLGTWPMISIVSAVNLSDVPCPLTSNHLSLDLTMPKPNNIVFFQRSRRMWCDESGK